MNSLPRIVFDLDGTLVDSAPSLCKAGNLLLDQINRENIDVEIYKRFIGKGLLKQVEQLLVYSGGIPDDDLLKFFKMFKEFYNLNPLIATSPYDGVYDALGSLRSISPQLAICTQKMEEPARAVLRGLKLEHFFDGFAFGDSLPVMKPDPAMVEHSVDSFSKGPLIYVGDSEIDSLAAQNVGAVFLLFSGGYRNSPLNKIYHDAVFDHHDQILPLVKKILSETL